MPQPYTIEQQKAIALAKARKRKQAAMAGPGPEVGPLNETVKMPFTVQQMPLDARRDWMEANAPNAVTQPQREKTGMGEALMLGTIDMGGPAATAPAGALGADVDADMTAALQDRPVSFRLGQGLALGAGPGAAGWKLGEKAMTKAGSVISPAIGATSKSAGSKAVRYLGRGAGLGILGLAENFGFNTLAEGRNQNRLDTGESQGVGDVERGLEVAADDALNPVAALAPAAASGIFRVGKYAKSGGQTFTPDAVAARVDQALTPSSRQTLPATLVGAIDPAAEKQLVRLLHNEGGFSRDDITAALNTFEQSIQDGTELALLPSRLKDVLAEQLGERARKPIDDFLQGAGNRKGGESGRIVGEAVAEDAPRLSQFLEDSANSRFGSANRYDTLEAAEQEMGRIGQEGYETVFRNQPTNRAGVESLKEAAQFFAGSELSKPLRQIAAGKMMDVDQMIQVDPRRAAHWMQHTANLKARQAADAGDTVTANAYKDMRQQLLRRLEADGVAPGYQQARMEFGDEFSNAAALGFGDRFVSVAEDQMKLGKLLKEMEGMTPTERDAAMLSIRDAVLKPAMRRTEGGLPRMAIIGREPVLNALERLGSEGTAFANDVRKTAERVGRTQQIDPRTGSNTMNKQEAAAFAEKSVANPLVRAIGNTMQNMGGDAAISGATGVFSPIMTGRAMLRKGGDMLANGRQGKIDALTDLLARDMGSAPRSPMSGDPTPSGGGNVFAKGSKPVQQSTQQPVNAFSPVKSAGVAGLRSDAGTAAVGGAVGGAAPAESTEDRVRNVFAGAAIGATGSRLDRMLPKRGGGAAARTANDLPFNEGQTFYHATNAPEFSQFKVNPKGHNRLGKGVYLTSSQDDARGFLKDGRIVETHIRGDVFDAKRGSDEMVQEVAQRTGLDPQKVAKTILRPDGRYSGSDKATEMLKKAGFSGVTDTDGHFPSQVMVFDPADVQIKGQGGVSSAGFGDKPKTAQQAAKMEIPGSPEWDAARAKGFDMSQAGRMKRAKQMGFDTDTVLYHGTKSDFDAFKVGRPGKLGPGVYFSPDKRWADHYAKVGSLRPDPPRTIEAFVRGRMANIDQYKNAYKRAAREFTKTGYDPSTRANEILREEGFDGVSAIGEVVIFDPSNIRSVNAAFDPDNIASPVLTAGFGGGKPPKLRKDVPTGTPKQAGQSRMSGSIQRGLEESSSMGAAKATGDKAVRQKTAMSEANRMAEAGRNYVDVFDKTGVVLIPYKGGTIKYYAPGADHPDTVIRTFISDLNKPLEKRQPMTNSILSAIGEQEKPLMLGRANTPMIEGTGRTPENVFARKQ